MDRDAAEAFVGVWAATTAAPVLSEADVTACIDQALTVDADGYLVTDDGYTETVDGNRAVYAAWALKVARAVATVDVSGDGTSVAGSQFVAALERQRRVWLARCVPASGGDEADDDVWFTG